LKLVTCAEYVYSPFGMLRSKADVKNSLLSDFEVKDRTDSMDIGAVEFQILTLNNSKLILFFDNDAEASKHSYVFKGDIQDKEVKFVNGVTIGMTKEDFTKIFFETFPQDKKYTVFTLTSCVDDIEHVYAFKNEKLESVSFKNDSYWKVEY